MLENPTKEVSAFDDIVALARPVINLSIKHLSDNAISLLQSQDFANRTGFTIRNMSEIHGEPAGFYVDTRHKLDNVQIADDLQAALDFALKHGFRIVIFNDDVRPVPELEVF